MQPYVAILSCEMKLHFMKHLNLNFVCFVLTKWVCLGKQITCLPCILAVLLVSHLEFVVKMKSCHCSKVATANELCLCCACFKERCSDTNLKHSVLQHCFSSFNLRILQVFFVKCYISTWAVISLLWQVLLGCCSSSPRSSTCQNPGTNREDSSNPN